MILLYDCARCDIPKDREHVEPIDIGNRIRYICRDCLTPEEALAAVSRLTDEMGLYDREGT